MFTGNKLSLLIKLKIHLSPHLNSKIRHRHRLKPSVASGYGHSRTTQNHNNDTEAHDHSTRYEPDFTHQRQRLDTCNALAQLCS